ncbi:hypothetical protein A2U01_0013916 [Trifolium medium]|uniref:RNase H type-1 domain-containing protein n=1 Tax=Trifolium medium TaxID=97028 RepID=A0A392MZK1_9FABA|nr:hypothetical protein [Trifolium medium]
MCQDCLPSRVQLRDRHVNYPSWCSLCLGVEEDDWHIFFWGVRRVNMLGLKLGLSCYGGLGDGNNSNKLIIGFGMEPKTRLKGVLCMLYIVEANGQFIAASSSWVCAKLTTIEGEALTLLEVIRASSTRGCSNVVFKNDSKIVADAIQAN